MGYVEAIFGHSCCEGQDLVPWQPEKGGREKGVEEVLGGSEGVREEGVPGKESPGKGRGY